MPTGTIVFFHSSEGYGFIKTDESDVFYSKFKKTDEDSESDVFVHIDDIEEPDLTKGTRVKFEIEDGPRGARATHVKRLSDAE
jgi:CspA family cold shock protein